MTTTRKCRIDGCERKVAYSFNELCNDHWEERITENILRISKEYKEKK